MTQKPNIRKEPQPAKLSYWFGPGWRKFGEFLHNLWKEEGSSIRICYLHYLSATIFTMKGIFWFLASLAVAVFGTIYTAFISVVFIVVLSVLYLAIYLGFSIVWLIDRSYLQQHKIFSACPNCKEMSLIPVYECPDCHAKHTNLVPGKYGIFHRTCNCGKVLGTTFFTGRKNLQAYCPKCGTPLADREDVPICIPIVGGRSVGKTAFITAFSKEFFDSIAPAHDWNTEFYNDEKKEIYDEICKDYDYGTTRMTQTSQDLEHAVSSVSFSFFLSGKDLKPERLVHIYDIAGEVFTQNAEAEIQKQYEYCQGIVLLLDPFSIPAVRYAYENDMPQEDRDGIGTADIASIVDSFLNKLREVTGLSDKQMFNTPIAIVINKIDSAGLYRELGPSAIQNCLNQMEDQTISDMDAEDFVCRNFLRKYDMEDFLKQIDVRFKTNRYFACSAIGHTRDHGRYAPSGVIEPMEWLFGNADRVIHSKWNDHKFGRVPIAQKLDR